MPSAQTILNTAAVIANDWRTLAITWHLFFGTLLLALLRGWRPSSRFAGYILVAPLLSVSALAWSSGNPFNGTTFAALGLLLIALASRLSTHPVRIASPLLLLPGTLLFAFGWVYPHFLDAKRWTAYLYAAPLGLLPCPTLSTVLGLTLMLGIFRSKAWSITLAAAGFLYGAMGVFTLRVTLDYGLLTGALLLGAAAAISTTSRSVRADLAERTRQLPGDELIPEPVEALTHAITVQCPRRDVWPWLAQMGAGSRAGWYSYDFLDNAGRPSATSIVPELQHLATGMIFPALPGARDGFTVLGFELEHFLILDWISPDSIPIVTWTFVLENMEPSATRLIVRARGGRGYRFCGLPWWLAKCIIPAVHFIMQRKQLLGIANRAEQEARSRTLRINVSPTAGKDAA